MPKISIYPGDTALVFYVVQNVANDARRNNWHESPCNGFYAFNPLDAARRGRQEVGQVDALVYRFLAVVDEIDVVQHLPGKSRFDLLQVC